MIDVLVNQTEKKINCVIELNIHCWGSSYHKMHKNTQKCWKISSEISDSSSERVLTSPYNTVKESTEF